MKKILKIFVLPALLFISMFSFVACTNSISIDSKAHFYATWGGATVLHNLPEEAWEYSNYGDSNKILVSSKSEVDALLGQTYSKTWSEEEQSWVQDDQFTTLISKFDEEFFQENQIVTFFVTASGGGYHFELSSTDYNNGVLTITLQQKTSGDGDGHCALVPWFAIVEIEKIPAYTQIKVQLENRAW